METGFFNRTTVVDGLEYPYQVYVPREYDGTRGWPVILFLHGAGERGTDGLLQTEVGLLSAVRRTPEQYPAITVAPQAPPDSIWQGRPAQAALQALDRTIEEFRTDASRICLTGLSMGGSGVVPRLQPGPLRRGSGRVRVDHTDPGLLPCVRGGPRRGRGGDPARSHERYRMRCSRIHAARPFSEIEPSATPRINRIASDSSASSSRALRARKT